MTTSDSLLGDTGVAYSAAAGVEANPANAAFVDRTQIFWEPELIKSESMAVRYPGFDANNTGTTGLGSIASKPEFIFKPTSHFGIGGFALPPGLGTSINVTRVPVEIFGQESYADLSGAGKLAGLAELFAAYRFSDKFGIGFNVTYESLTFNANLLPSGGGTALATINGSQSSTDFTVGIRLDPAPGRFGFGLAIDLVSIQKVDLEVTSPLLATAGGAGGAPGGGATTSTLPLASIRGGMNVALTDRIRLLVDGIYTRFDTSQQGYSLVNLKSEPKDLHNTMAVRSGAIIRWSDNANALVGFRYEPASIGGGSKAGGLVGFGTQDLIEIEAGQGALMPFYQVSAGVQYGFGLKEGRERVESKEHEGKEGRDGREGHEGGRESNREHRKVIAAAHPYYQWTLEAGVVYRYASLGVDENGELPGAYLDTKISIPVAVLYRF